MKLLSIIVPVYNKSKYMDSCIQTILCQTITDFELILINDGSIDDSGKICDNYAKKDQRVIVIHQKNEGVSSARNAGLMIASGKYIGFVDSDDILHPRMYETLIKNIEDYHADLSICGVRRVSPDKIEMFGGLKRTKIYNTNEAVSGLFRGEILLSNYDKLYRKERIKNIYFKPALFEDTYFNFEAILASKITVFDDTILYDYMIRENSHSLAAFNPKYMNAIKLSKQITEFCEKNLPRHDNESKAFHFNILMMVLNMILIESRKLHQSSFNSIKNELAKLHYLYLKSNIVHTRYKFGYSIFRISPFLYNHVLNLYCRITNSEHLTRKKRLKD